MDEEEEEMTDCDDEQFLLTFLAVRGGTFSPTSVWMGQKEPQSASFPEEVESGGEEF